MSFIKETVLSLGTKWLQSYNSTWLLSIQYKTLQIVSFNFYSKSQKQYFWLPTHTFWSPHSHFDLFMGGMSSKEFRWNAFQLNNTNNSQWNIPNRPITFFFQFCIILFCLSIILSIFLFSLKRYIFVHLWLAQITMIQI